MTDRGAMSIPKLGYNTQALVDEAEFWIAKACRMISRNKEKFGAVNWGDIGVREVEYRWPVYPAGDPYCVVTVEEASPDCELGRWLSQKISAKFPQAHVECEW